jgi:hypothetical protein
LHLLTVFSLYLTQYRNSPSRYSFELTVLLSLTAELNCPLMRYRKLQVLVYYHIYKLSLH